MKKRLISLLLTLAMAASLATSALAYSSPDFSDVPAENWAYKYVMEMADAGVIKGTGAGMFSPDKKVSAEMLLTLVGRIAFPEVKVGKEDTWYGPYVKAAQSAGWLEGTKIDPTDTAAEVTRYDMAVVLAFAAKKLGIAEKTVDTGKIKDFGEIPNKYTTAVTQVYGNGLIKGDGNGNFSGTSTMRRDEAATVMSRLIALKPDNPTTDPGTTKTDRPIDPEAKYTFLLEAGCHPRADYDPSKVELVEGDRIRIDRGFRTEQAENSPYISYSYFRVGETYQFTVCKVPAGYGYTLADVEWSSENEKVATVDQNGVVTMVGPGSVGIYAKIPVRYYNDHFVDDMDAITIYVDP